MWPRYPSSYSHELVVIVPQDRVLVPLKMHRVERVDADMSRLPFRPRPWAQLAPALRRCRTSNGWHVTLDNLRVVDILRLSIMLPNLSSIRHNPELRFSNHIEQTAIKALGKLNILRKLSGTSWGSRPQTLKSTFCTVIRPVLEYATPIWTPASISYKQKLDSVQHRAAKIIIGAVSSTNNEKAEQECGLPPLESRRKLATIKLKRSSTLQLDSEIRKELNLEHSSLEFLQEPLIPKNPPKNTCFKLELLRTCSKKEDPATLRQKGLETIEIPSQNNFAIAYTDGSSDRSLSNGGAGILLLLPDGNNYKHKINTGIIASNFTSELMAIREALILYQQDPHVIDSTEGLVIFSDSKSAIEAIRNGETNISCDIITLLEQLHSKRKSCILQWIPAHVNIENLNLEHGRCSSTVKIFTPNSIKQSATIGQGFGKFDCKPKCATNCD
ncbi:RNase H domain-containing protein [Trichonephila clavipes]|uniref:RNase H domain-containing protein n=1 Tax=Trichonephila clavipes TaxID=2585209 RepID=A0A8X6RUN8_TRICX|nr:RNase H domain-containing protein [Trichonephila clavipes]